MSRALPYLGVIMALLIGVFAVALVNSAPLTEAPAATTIASPTPSAPDITTPATPATSSTPTPAPKKIVKQTSSGRNTALDAAVPTLIGALVNIICYVPPTSGLHSISASGIIIDPKGIILTNAHVAQYFLLADRGVSCSIRTGRPAVDRYTAAPIYISPLWIRANPTVLTEANPTGTGQYDFALLAVTASADSTPLPTSFPFEPLATEAPLPGTPVVIATYGAQTLASKQIQSNLYSTVVSGSIKEVFTFGKDTIDVLSVLGSAAAQEGSSGGGIADASGKLVATITTSAIEGDTSTRSLDAITATYIQAQFQRETGGPLNLLLAEPTATAVANFASQIPILEAVLTTHLP